MKKVLIVGAKGMLGQDLAKVFGKDKKYEVVGWDMEDLDITDKKQVKQKISELKPDLIINAAAYNAVDKCEEDKNEFKLAKEINGKAVGYLASVAQYLKIPIVHFGSDYIFDGKNPNGYKENAKPSPLNRYALSKYFGEKELKKTTRKYYLIRTSKLFGMPATSAVGKKSFFELILTLSKDRKEFNMVDEEMSCFTYTPDLAKRVKEIIEKKMPFGTYHVINTVPCTWYGAAVELFKQAGIKDVKLNPSTSEQYPRPAKRPDYSILINTKLKPMRSYKAALKEFLQLIKA